MYTPGTSTGTFSSQVGHKWHVRHVRWPVFLGQRRSQRASGTGPLGHTQRRRIVCCVWHPPLVPHAYPAPGGGGGGKALLLHKRRCYGVILFPGGRGPSCPYPPPNTCLHNPVNAQTRLTIVFLTAGFVVQNVRGPVLCAGCSGTEGPGRAPEDLWVLMALCSRLRPTPVCCVIVKDCRCHAAETPPRPACPCGAHHGPVCVPASPSDWPVLPKREERARAGSDWGACECTAGDGPKDVRHKARLEALGRTDITQKPRYFDQDPRGRTGV